MEIIKLVLQQLGPGGCDIRTLCSLPQVSTACRAAVYESGVSCSVTPKEMGCSDNPHPHPHNRCPADLQRLSGFAAWLPGNAGLVSSLELYAPSSDTDHAPAEQLFTAAVQLCAQQQATASAATSAVVQSQTPSGLPRPLRGLQLRWYRGDLLQQPAALAALGACSQLTRLEWRRKEVPAAASLRSFRHLSTLASLTNKSRHAVINAGCAKALVQACGQLQHLMHLTLEVALPPSELQQLPCSLLSLKIVVCQDI